MALIHKTIEIRQYAGEWEAVIEITDSVTGQVFHEMPMMQKATKPVEADFLPIITVIKQRIKNAQDMQNNALNDDTVVEIVVEELKQMKRAIIRIIRQDPGITYANMKIAMAKLFPNTMIDIDKLFKLMADRINVATWVEFKTWVASHVWREN